MKTLERTFSPNEQNLASIYINFKLWLRNLLTNSYAFSRFAYLAQVVNYRWNEASLAGTNQCKTISMRLVTPELFLLQREWSVCLVVYRPAFVFIRSPTGYYLVSSQLCSLNNNYACFRKTERVRRARDKPIIHSKLGTLRNFNQSLNYFIQAKQYFLK